MSERTFEIGGMTCANCATEVQDGVARLPGIESVHVDYMTRKMIVVGNTPRDDIEKRVRALGKDVLDPQHDAPPASAAAAADNALLAFAHYLLDDRTSRFALVGGGLALLTLLLSLAGVLPAPAANAAYIVATFVALYPVAKSGITGLFINRSFNINLLMTIAAAGALVIGEYLEAAVLVFLFAVGEALEGYTAERARRNIHALMSLKPATARVLDFGLETELPVEKVRMGDLVLAKPGERIAMDGDVVAGESAVNQAPITGESVPVAKLAGDTVFAGTVNGDGALTIRVTQLAADNTINRIIAMVEEAQANRAPSQRQIDRFATWYTPTMVGLAAIVALAPPLLTGAPLLGTSGWLYRALVLLVIACPCALVISTPVTVISAITAAARRGVLIKGGVHLEALAAVKAMAFDKTGTLTWGTPVVTRYRAADCEVDDVCERCDDLLALASAVEQRTTHPLADAVVTAASKRALATAYAPAENVQQLAGMGVQGDVAGRTVTVGSHRLFDERYPHSDALCAEVSAAEANGQTTILLADDDTVRGYVALADSARDSSRDAIHALNALGLATVMLTGDNATVARAIASDVGVREVRAGLLPGDKVAALQAWQQQYGPTAMVGDGINDAPALAAASVGIAMGGAGSAQALETADIALMADDLSQLPVAVRLARFARRLIWQNIALSIAVKLVFVVLALFGLTTLWLAIFADVGMLVLVSLNGMRPVRAFNNA